MINGEEQPNLVLVRGARYIFDVSVGAQHPFLLQKMTRPSRWVQVRVARTRRG